MIQFKKATRSQQKLRLLLEGASGSGKTSAALVLGKEFGKIAVIDTERGSAALYSDRAEFDTLVLEPPFEPERFVEAIQAAENLGYDVIIIDGIAPEWAGPGGCLEIQAKLGGRYQDWGKVSPRHEKFVQAILGSKCHVIATCRAKQAYSMDQNTKKVEKLGMEPQQRDGLDYEMTVVFHLNQSHTATANKDRTGMFDGRDAPISAETARKLLAWLNEGEPMKEPPKDYRALARAEYAKLGAEKAEPIRVKHGENWQAMYEEMSNAG